MVVGGTPLLGRVLLATYWIRAGNRFCSAVCRFSEHELHRASRMKAACHLLRDSADHRLNGSLPLRSFVGCSPLVCKLATGVNLHCPFSCLPDPKRHTDRCGFVCCVMASMLADKCAVCRDFMYHREDVRVRVSDAGSQVRGFGSGLPLSNSVSGLPLPGSHSCSSR